MLKLLAEDDAFLETILGRVTVCQSTLRSLNLDGTADIVQNPKEPTADDLSMLLANLSKSPAFERLIVLERSKVADLIPSKRAITQMIKLFNRGADKMWNKDGTYDYLAYMFADLAKV